MILSVARAKDRALMVERVREIFALAKDGAIIHDFEFLKPRERRIGFRHAGGLVVTIEFDGDSSQDREGDFCMAWNIMLDSEARISQAFGSAVGAEVNPYHRRKCTAFSHRSFEDLCAKLTRAVACINAGEAYE